MSYKLDKPYTDKQRADFVVQYAYNLGLKIEETKTALYALEMNEILQNELPVVNPNYQQEQLQKEQERIAKLNLTAADVERAIYKVKGMDFEDIIKLVENNPDIDLKALKIELKANNFYRGNPYINKIGQLLGFTSQQLDEFFETNDYTKLKTQQ